VLLITNRKSHIGFQLVPKSVTLNDPERRKGSKFCVISPNLVALGPYYANVVEYTLMHSASEMPQESIFQRYITSVDIRRESPQRGAKM